MKIVEDLLKKYRGETIVEETPQEKEAREKAEALANETPEAKEAREAAEALENETPEAKAAREAAEAEANAGGVGEVSAERFDKLEALVTGMAEMMNEHMTAQAAQKPVAEQVSEAFTAHLKNLPRSNAQPPKAVTKVTTPGETYVPSFQNFRERLAEIESKTRLS